MECVINTGKVFEGFSFRWAWLGGKIVCDRCRLRRRILMSRQCFKSTYSWNDNGRDGWNATQSGRCIPTALRAHKDPRMRHILLYLINCIYIVFFISSVVEHLKIEMIIVTKQNLPFLLDKYTFVVVVRPCVGSKH